MPDQSRPPVLRYLRAVLGPEADGPTDADLLGRFVADRDQAAFELLVYRHAGMLMRVSRGVLRDHHAAEDITQAAFLVLARKAGSVGRREAVAGWLYRVAHRLAVRTARRRKPDLNAELDALATPDTAKPDDLSPLLHAELARLPDRYRVPVLLCFFEGLSHADAARRLGWPVGTVAGRIARAKDELQRRLGRKGVMVGVASLLGVEAAPAVAPPFADATARAAVLFAAGAAVVPGVSPPVLVLASGALRTMTAIKLQWAAGILAACSVLTLGGVGVWASSQQGSGPGGPAAGPTAGAAAGPVDPPPLTPLDKLSTHDNGKLVTIELLVRDIRRGKSQTRKPDDADPDDLILSGIQSLENDDRVQITLTGAARPDWSKWEGAPEYRGVKYLRRKVRATGKLNAAMYTGFPAFMVYEVLVDDPRQLAAEQPAAAGAGTVDGASGGGGTPEPDGRTASSAQRLRCLNNLKQLMIAMHNYEAAYGHLPGNIRDKNGKALLSWRVAILPFIEQEALYRAFKFDEPWDSEHNLKLMAQMPPILRVGFEPKGSTHTYYQVFEGPGTPFGPSRFPPGGGAGDGTGDGGGGSAASGGSGSPGRPPIGAGAPGNPPPPAGGGAAAPGVGALGAGFDQPPKGWPHVRLLAITDGTSNTLGVVEAGPPVPWTKPADITYDPKKPLPKLAGPFSNALHVAFMDGFTMGLKRGIKDDALKVLIGMDDGIVTPDRQTLNAPMPAETAEEKAQLKEMIAANQQSIERIEVLMKEHVALLSRQNQASTDLVEAEERMQELRRIAEELRRMNDALKGRKDPPAVTKDAPPKPARKE
jgi:RNA polymerase sigma factor (sigma-70 family)